MYLDTAGQLKPEESLYGRRSAGVPGTVAGIELARRAQQLYNPFTLFAALLGSLHRRGSAIEVVADEVTIDSEEAGKQTVTTIGLDIAKSVFQVHGIDAAGKVVVRQQLKRSRVLGFFTKLQPCLVGIEACASSHYWSRELQGLGHTVKLMPPAYVKPYLKRQKNDAADAEAISEAVQRPNMRFVPTKTPDQQACMMLHRTRHLFVRQQTAVINSIRAHLAEFGIVAPVGRNGVEELLAVINDRRDGRIPDLARICLTALRIQLVALKEQILILDRRINA